MFTLILVLLALFVFTAYNAVAIKKFGVPESLSNTFYLWNSVKKNLGYVFTGMMGFMAFTLMPAWLEVGNMASSWSSFLNFLIFFACGSIMFVGVAPAFRSSEMEGTVHETSAKLAAAAALAWCFAVCYAIWYVPVACILAVLIAGLLSKTFKKCIIYWLEMMAFAATFITVIVELFLNLV